MPTTIGSVKVDLVAQMQGSHQQHTIATIDLPIFASYPGEADAALEVSVKPELRRSELAAGFRAIADEIEAESSENPATA